MRALRAGLLLWAVVLAASCNRPSRVTAAEVARPNECDTVAAHPADAERLSKGVPDEEFVPALAEARCAEAVRADAGVARLRFQYGRALLVRGRIEQAERELNTAASQGYCAAKFLLGEVLLRRFATSERASDGESARKWFEEASACGFEPASKRLAELTFTPDGFRRPKIMTALYEGRIPDLNRHRLLVAVYLLGIHSYVSMDYHPKDSWCPSTVAQPDVQFKLDAAAVGDTKNFLDRTAVDMALAAIRKYGILIDPTWKGDPERYKELLADIGRKDGQLMAERFGCASGIFATIYANLVGTANTPVHITDYYANFFTQGSEGFLSAETKEILFGEAAAK